LPADSFIIFGEQSDASSVVFYTTIFSTASRHIWYCPAADSMARNAASVGLLLP